MATLSQRTFSVHLSDSSSSSSESRGARRVYVNADVLKQFKISAGDVLALIPTQTQKNPTSVSICSDSDSRNLANEQVVRNWRGMAFDRPSLTKYVLPLSLDIFISVLFIVVVQLSSSHFLTADLDEGSQITIESISHPSSSSRIPKLHEFGHAKTISLREITDPTSSTPPKDANKVGPKVKDWLTLYIRESLSTSLLLPPSHSTH